MKVMEHTKGRATGNKRHALVWVDHHEARVIHPVPDSDAFELNVVTGDDGATHGRKHDGGHRHAMSAGFTDRIASAVGEYGDLAITGPSTAKDELVAQLRERHPEVAQRVSVVEPHDRTTDPQLAASARQIFERVDRMRGIHVPR